MNTKALISGVSKSLGKVGRQIQKHSPEILVVAGVVGTVTSAVMACKATTKVSEIMETTKETVDSIHKCLEDTELVESGKYTVEDSKKDLTITYVQTGVKLVKLYAPSVILGALSITSILASNNILRKRNVALAAAYATVDKSFKSYRSRVVERFGDAVDKELRYNLKSKEVEEKVVDEKTGKEKKVKVVKQYVDPSEISGYARYFEEYTKDENGNSVRNYNWDRVPEYNLYFIKSRQQMANNLLTSRGKGGIVFLNEIYDSLGFPRTKAGQVVGWVNNGVDSYIDFGIYGDGTTYNDSINGFDPFLLDFNVDGPVWQLMKD